MPEPNQIELSVVIDQAQLIQSLREALEASPKALSQIASAIDPIAAAFDPVISKTDQWNKKLLEVAKSYRVMRQAQEDLEGRQTTGFGREQEIERLAILSRVQGQAGEEATKQLIALEQQLIQQLEKSSGLTQERLRWAEQIEQIQSILTANEQAQTAELQKQAKAQEATLKQLINRVQIAERLRDLPQSALGEDEVARIRAGEQALNQLIQRRNELNRLIEEGTLEQEKQIIAERQYNMILQATRRSREETIRLNREEIDALITKVRIAERYSEVSEPTESEVQNIREGEQALQRLLDLRREISATIRQEDLSQREIIALEKDLQKILNATREQKQSSVDVDREQIQILTTQLDLYRKLREIPTSQLSEDELAILDRGKDAYNELVQKRVELNQLINQGELSTEEQARAEKNLSIVIQSINRARQDSVRLNNEEIKALITKVQIAERYRDVQEADLDRDELLHIEEGKDALELLIQRRQELNRLIQSGNLSARDQVEAEQQLNTILQATRTNREAILAYDRQEIESLISKVRIAREYADIQTPTAAEADAINAGEAALERLLEIREELNETIQSGNVNVRHRLELEKQLQKVLRITKQEVDKEEESQEDVIDALIRKVKIAEEYANIDPSAIGREELASIREGEAALDELFTIRNELNNSIQSGTLSIEEQAKAEERLHQILRNTRSTREQAVRGEQEFENALRRNAILSRTSGERQQQALQELMNMRLREQEILEDEEQTLERIALAQERIERIQRAQMGGGTGRRALSRARSLQGPDPFGVLLDAGRIMQDISFGLVGIANNLGPFFTQFALFHSQFQTMPGITNTWAAAAANLAKATVFTPIGWILLLNTITSLIISWPKISKFFSDLMDTATEAEKRMRALNEEVDKLRLQKLGEIGDNFQVIAQSIRATEERITQLTEAREALAQRVAAVELAGAERGQINLELQRRLNRELEGQNRQHEEAVELLDELRKRFIDIRAEIQAQIQASEAGTAPGLFVQNAQQRRREADKALAELRLQFAEERSERIKHGRLVFNLEREIEGERLKQAIDNEEERLNLLREEHERHLQERIENGEKILEVELEAFRAIEMFQQQSLDAQKRLYSEWLDTRQEAWEKFLEDLFSEDRNKKIKDFEREIQDAATETQKLIIETTQQGVAQRIALLRLETESAKRELERQLKDFEGTEQQRLVLKAEYDRQIVLLEQKHQLELRSIRREARQEEFREAMELRDLRLRILDTEVRQIQTLEQRIAEERRETERRISDNQREIRELQLQEETEYTRQRIELLQQLNEAEREALDERIRLIEADQLRADQEIFKRVAEDLMFTMFELDETRAELFLKGKEREEALRRIERERLEASLEIWLEEQLRIAQTIQNEEIMLDTIIALYEEYFARLEIIRSQGADQQFKFLNEEQERLAQWTLKQANLLTRIADMRYDTFVERRRRELIESGKTEQEATKQAQEEGEARLKQYRTLAKLEIVASTAYAMMKAYESGVALPLPPPFNHAAGLAAAGLALAFGRAQYAAVDNDNIRGIRARGGSVQVNVGEEAPPGLARDINLFRSPYDIAADFNAAQEQQAAANLDGLRSLEEEMRSTREGLNALMEAYANRPVYADVPERNALRIKKSAEEYEKSLTRG